MVIEVQMGVCTGGFVEVKIKAQGRCGPVWRGAHNRNRPMVEMEWRMIRHKRVHLAVRQPNKHSRLELALDEAAKPFNLFDSTCHFALKTSTSCLLMVKSWLWTRFKHAHPFLPNLHLGFQLASPIITSQVDSLNPYLSSTRHRSYILTTIPLQSYRFVL